MTATWTGGFSTASSKLFLAVMAFPVVALISVGATFMITARKPQPPYPTCGRCGYDLTGLPRVTIELRGVTASISLTTLRMSIWSFSIIGMPLMRVSSAGFNGAGPAGPSTPRRGRDPRWC